MFFLFKLNNDVCFIDIGKEMFKAASALTSSVTGYKTIIVIAELEGPLLLQLKMHISRKCVVVQGFELNDDGERGEIEKYFFFKYYCFIKKRQC